MRRRRRRIFPAPTLRTPPCVHMLPGWVYSIRPQTEATRSPVCELVSSSTGTKSQSRGAVCGVFVPEALLRCRHTRIDACFLALSAAPASIHLRPRCVALLQVHFQRRIPEKSGVEPRPRNLHRRSQPCVPRGSAPSVQLRSAPRRLVWGGRRSWCTYSSPAVHRGCPR